MHHKVAFSRSQNISHSIQNSCPFQILARSIRLLLVTAAHIGRINTPLLAPNVGNLGPIKLDNYPTVHMKELLQNEAHRHPYIEQLGLIYLMKLRHAEFGKRAGSCWRLIFVYALMPWLHKYRISTRTEQGQEGSRSDLAKLYPALKLKSVRNMGSQIDLDSDDEDEEVGFDDPGANETPSRIMIRAAAHAIRGDGAPGEHATSNRDDSHRSVYFQTQGRLQGVEDIEDAEQPLMCQSFDTTDSLEDDNSFVKMDEGVEADAEEPQSNASSEDDVEFNLHPEDAPEEYCSPSQEDGLIQEDIVGEDLVRGMDPPVEEDDASQLDAENHCVADPEDSGDPEESSVLYA